MTSAQRMGIFFLASGTLILSGVIFVWLAAPFSIPTPSSTQAAVESSSTPNSAPALSPYTPPTPASLENNSIEVLPSAKTSAAPDPSAELAAMSSASDFSVFSYEEVQLLRGRDRALSKPILHLSIPALSVDAPVIPVGLEERPGEGSRSYRQWTVPDAYAVGWHDSSAPPGQTGNTVLNGHNNVHGAVFGNLVDLTLGDQIILHEADQQFIYQVVHREFLPERGESLRTRLLNARWIAPSDDSRLTIVTCWPNSSNSHRLVVIAQPIPAEPGL